ncbi:MAG: ABC transporter permease [Elainellaceae cyanobacterium]
MLSTLDRKLVRDLMHQWGQIVAIALVVACGIACFVLMQSAHHSLTLTQTAYYDRYRFADLFAELKRAPDNLHTEIAAIPGVAQVQTRLVSDVTLDIPGLDEPATGRLISIPPDRDLVLNDLFIRRGTWVDPQRPEEVMISDAFAEANQLQLGDSFGAILNGRWQTLRVVGIALSPEYVYAIRGGADIYPDNRRFGVLWMGEDALGNAFDMDGAFNSVALKLMPETNQAAVIDRLDRLLAPYGGLGAYGRADQVSNRVLSDEIQSLEVMATMLPTIFLAIAAFLLHVVLSRLVATQREQIAVLKAFGYGNLSIGWHYLKFVWVVFSLGAVLGIAVGMWLGRGLTQLYTSFFRFPLLQYEADIALILTALLVSGGAAVVGGLIPVRHAVMLPPAQAMRPEPPATFRPTLVERWGLQQMFSPTGRIILRNLERRPIRALLSILGIGAAAAILLVGFYFNDAISWLMHVQFQIVQQEDITLVFNEPRSVQARYDVNHLPGVLRSEVFRSVPARLRHEHYDYRLAVTGIPPSGTLRNLIDRHLNPVRLPPEGVVLTTKLAEILHIEPGQRLTVEVLEGDRPVRHVMVTGQVDELLGLSAYMDIHALNQLMREGQTVSGAYLSVDQRQADPLYRQLKRIPAVAGVSFREAMLQSFEELSAQNIQVMTIVLVAFACIITFSVVYNSARIALSERGRELASLRIMGFTQREVAVILLGEQTLLTVVAIPVGLLLGFGLAAWLTLSSAYNSELYRLPLVIHRASYGMTTLVVLISMMLSGFLIYRQLQRLDLIATLKTRE